MCSGVLRRGSADGPPALIQPVWARASAGLVRPLPAACTGNTEEILSLREALARFGYGRLDTVQALFSEKQ